MIVSGHRMAGGVSVRGLSVGGLWAGGWALAALAMCAAPAAADTQAIVDLTGVQIRNATNQSRSSNPDAIDPGCFYQYAITGNLRGSGLILGGLFPNPTPIATVLETLAPGSSAFLNGSVAGTNTHPVGLLNQRIEGSTVLLGFTVTFSADFSVGIDANDFVFFSLTNVTISPAALVGSMTFTDGRATVTSTPPCAADFNNDCFVDFFDLDDFVACFEGAGCPPGKSADFNGDGFADFFDFDDFVAAFESGCV